MIVAEFLSEKMALPCFPGRVFFPVLIIWAVMAPPGSYSSAAQDAQVFGTVYALQEMTPLPGTTVVLAPVAITSDSWRFTVAGEDAETASPLECITGPDGTFLFEDIGPGKYLLQARGRGIGLSQEHYVEVVPLGRSLEPFPIHTTPGGALQGRVYNKNSQEGLADIAVFARVEGTPQRFSTVTNADGDYAFENLPPGSCDIHLSCSFRPISHSRQACIRDNYSISAFDFALDIPGTNNGIVTGRVVDCTGTPIAKVTVIAQYPVRALGPHRAAQSMAKTDETGRFTLADLDPDNPFTLAALKTGYAFYHEEVRPRPEENVVVELRPEAVIAGVVHDKSGRPVENARVNVWQGAPRHTGHTLLWPGEHAMAYVSRNGVSSKTTKDGVFRIGGLAAGEHRVEVKFEPGRSILSSHFGHDFQKHFVARESDFLEEGQTLSGLTLSLKLADHLSSISGYVVTSDGYPVPGAAVRADNARYTGRTTTNLDGAFTIIGLPHGAYWLETDARGYEHYSSFRNDDLPFERGRITTGAEPVTLVLTESIRVEGRVVNAETGAPIPIFQIGVGDSQEAPLRIAPGTLRTQLEPQGRFALDLKRPAAYIIARAEGFETSSQALRINVKAAHRDILLELSPAPDSEEKVPVPDDGACQESTMK